LHSASQSFIEHLENVEEESAERERFRITRELHDEIGYSMTNVTMMMNAAPHLVTENTSKLLEYCLETKQVASRTQRETRKILYKLRDIQKQALPGLPIFFSKLCMEFSKATGIHTECNTGNLPERINENIRNILYRTVQVGFINGLRHGNAGHIKLFFWQDKDELRMTIWNDVMERVVDVSSMHEGIGLKGVRERIESVRGKISMGQSAGGFRLQVAIPSIEVSIESDTSDNS
ncbi:MAG: hypothetical protein HN368_00190, partial [Spirochaetales bacterium]|nr:hypothetical protein [Spirochaetales bacterium]